MVATVEQFISHWKGASGGERAQAQSFLNDLCRVLGVDAPKDGDYKYEYSLKGAKATDFADLYKRGCFVLEAKQSRAKGGKKAIDGQLDLLRADEQDQAKAKAGRSWDLLMMNARQQAEGYARALPSNHDWPPFIIICDVGHCFEVFADFTGKGRHYEQFPDRQGFRVFMDDFRKPEVVDQFRKMWEDPHSLNPAAKAAKATREIAKALAEVSKRLEKKNFPPEEVALFLMRCLFTMFAEDVELIPKNSFTDLLERCTTNPKSFMPNLNELWKAMNGGGFSVALGVDVKRFNGKLFADARVFEMDREEIGVLKAAAARDWKEVDPSIFGTLLEQALEVSERASLGAHYTPRAYVERLVQATVMEPLREEWNHIRGSLELDPKEAVQRIHDFHVKLCETRVLDPACGTGNFLYVTLELMKRLEGEVLDLLLQLGGQEALRLETFTVDPHQFLGIEKNPRAAAIADLVLWIGFLRWHLRTKGEVSEPVLREFKNIERRDAVLEHAGVDAKGNYIRPRRPQWPEAEYIVGNPPFIGNKRMREQLGGKYLEALWEANTSIPKSADFVMFWWDRAADLLVRKDAVLRRFGLVTTNSITQTFNRRLVESYLKGKPKVSIVFAVADHPWTKVANDSAAVRIAMTVAVQGESVGTLMEVLNEDFLDTDSPLVELRATLGGINSDLTIGTNLPSTIKLLANEGLSHQGIIPVGEGFRLDRKELEHLGYDPKALPATIRRYLIGRDIVQNYQERFIIDFYGLSSEECRERFPRLWQIVLERVKPQRDLVRREKTKNNFWIYAEPRSEMRSSLRGLARFVVTCRTSKHRVFTFIDSSHLADAKLIAFASDDAALLGFLNSHTHLLWAEKIGAWLGVGNDSNYNHSECFNKFPFPTISESQLVGIARIAEGLDRHRKDVQAAHPDITLTEMYNVLEKVKAGEALDDDDKRVHDDALILILKERHEELDAAVAAAYGWPVDLPDEEILSRLVALNKERAAEEAKGFVRWLRPEYQIPRFGSAQEKAAQIEADLEMPAIAAAARMEKASFPTRAQDQVAAVMAALAALPEGASAAELSRQFKQGKKVEGRVAATLASLTRTGFIAASAGGKNFSLRRSTTY